MSQKVYHLRTNVKNNKPESSQIEIGEIALNYASDSETIMFKNDADEIVEFKDSKYYEKLIDENELVTANALNNLNDRVLVIEDVIDNAIFNEIENLYEEISKKQDSSDELNEVIENFNEKIESINEEISDLDYIRDSISNNKENIANIREEISDLNVIRENISNNKEEINDIGHELVDIYQEISDVNKVIEDNEKVISAAITDLNEKVTLAEDNAASISESLTEFNKVVEDNKIEINEKIQEVNQRVEKDELVTATALTDLNERVTLVENGEIENPYFKSFATLDAYETAVANGEVVYPCVAFIEESGTLKFMINVVYNAVVTLSEEYVAMLGHNYKTQFGFYPLCSVDYFDSVVVDGVEMIGSAETVVVNGVSINVIRFPSEEIGTSYNVSFKVKEEPEILVTATDEEINSNVSLVSPFFGTLSYIEIDESFRNRGLSTDSGTYYHMCSIMPSLNRNFHVKFKGDYLGSVQTLNRNNGSYLYMLIYGQIMLVSDPSINVNITFSIPSGNTTYGTPDDILVEDDINTYTFYAEYNYMQQNNDAYPNLSLSVETY